MNGTISYGGTTKCFIEIAGGRRMIAQELTRGDRVVPQKGAAVGLAWRQQDMLVIPAPQGLEGQPG